MHSFSDPVFELARGFQCGVTPKDGIAWLLAQVEHIRSGVWVSTTQPRSRIVYACVAARPLVPGIYVSPLNVTKCKTAFYGVAAFFVESIALPQHCQVVRGVAHRGRAPFVFAHARVGEEAREVVKAVALSFVVVADEVAA